MKKKSGKRKNKLMSEMFWVSVYDNFERLEIRLTCQSLLDRQKLHWSATLLFPFFSFIGYFFGTDYEKNTRRVLTASHF